MEKTKRRRGKRNHKTGGCSLNELSAEQEKLSLKVSNLLKKHNLPAVKQLVKGQDDLKPWSQEIKAKVYVSSEAAASRFSFIFYFLFLLLQH